MQLAQYTNFRLTVSLFHFLLYEIKFFSRNDIKKCSNEPVKPGSIKLDTTIDLSAYGKILQLIGSGVMLH